MFVLIRLPEAEGTERMREREDGEQEIWECDIGCLKVDVDISELSSLDLESSP